MGDFLKILLDALASSLAVAGILYGVISWASRRGRDTHAKES
jgi:hypothetical protein